MGVTGWGVCFAWHEGKSQFGERLRVRCAGKGRGKGVEPSPFRVSLKKMADTWGRGRVVKKEQKFAGYRR